MRVKKRQLDQSFLDAILLRNHAAVQHLLREGADPNAREPEHRQAAIILATIARDARTVKLLISEGAAIEAQDDRGRTALFFADVNSEIFDTLISAGANKHAVDYDGNTILMNGIARSASAAEVEKLLKLGFDREVKNTDGESALDIAVQLGLVNVVEQLRY